MQSKKNNLTYITIGGLLIIITVVAISFYTYRPQSMAAASNNTAQQSLPIQIQSSYTSTPQITSGEVLTQTVNDITVEITSAQIISTGIEIGICYTTADNGEWRPMPGHLFYGKYEVYPDEIEFTPDEILADGKNTGTRCAFIRYRVDDLKTITTPINFSILKFYAPPREMYSPCQEVQQRLDTNPKAQAYGLKISCSEKADGNRDVTLLSNDNSITQDEAQKELDVISNAEVQGNWMFTITDLTK